MKMSLWNKENETPVLMWIETESLPLHCYRHHHRHRYHNSVKSDEMVTNIWFYSGMLAFYNAIVIWNKFNKPSKVRQIDNFFSQHRHCLALEYGVFLRKWMPAMQLLEIQNVNYVISPRVCKDKKKIHLWHFIVPREQQQSSIFKPFY